MANIPATAFSRVRDMDRDSTSHVEVNMTKRTNIRRLARLTNGREGKTEKHVHAMALLPALQPVPEARCAYQGEWRYSTPRPRWRFGQPTASRCWPKWSPCLTGHKLRTYGRLTTSATAGFPQLGQHTLPSNTCHCWWVTHPLSILVASKYASPRSGAHPVRDARQGLAEAFWFTTTAERQEGDVCSLSKV